MPQLCMRQAWTLAGVSQPIMPPHSGPPRVVAIPPPPCRPIPPHNGLHPAVPHPMTPPSISQPSHPHPGRSQPHSQSPMPPPQPQVGSQKPMSQLSQPILSSMSRPFGPPTFLPQPLPLHPSTLVPQPPAAPVPPAAPLFLIGKVSGGSSPGRPEAASVGPAATPPAVGALPLSMASGAPCTGGDGGTIFCMPSSLRRIVPPLPLPLPFSYLRSA